MASYNWKSAVSGSWNNPLLWLPNGPPPTSIANGFAYYTFAADDAVFNTGSASAYTVTGDAHAASISVQHDQVTFSNFTFNNNSGGYTVPEPAINVSNGAAVTVNASASMSTVDTVGYPYSVDGPLVINNASVNVLGSLDATLDLQAGGVLTVGNGGRFYSPVTNHSPMPLAVVEQGGILNVEAGSTVNAPFARMAGTLNINGATAPGGAIQSTGIVNGSNGGVLTGLNYNYLGNIANDGVIAATAGLFTIQTQSIAGTGHLAIAAGAKLAITDYGGGGTLYTNSGPGLSPSRNITVNNDLVFQQNASLLLRNAVQDNGILLNFGVGDSVDLTELRATTLTATDRNGVTTVTASGTPTGQPFGFSVSFKLGGDYSLNDLALGEDGAGGSLVSFVDHSPVPVVTLPPLPTPPAAVVAPTPTPTVAVNEGRRGDGFGLNSDSSVVFSHGGKTDTLYGLKEIDFIDGREVFDANDPVASIVRLYQAALGRAPDQGGLHYWSYALAHGSTLTDLANGFQSSPEFITRFGGDLPNADYVSRIYQNVLGRTPDASGLAFWQGNLDNGTATRAQMLAGISESAENKAATAPAVATGIWDLDETAARVARLYDAALGRLPDGPGLTYWTGDIKGGAPLLDLANAFVGSAEFTATYGALDNSAFVGTVYQNTLHRAADPGGAGYWVNMLNAGTTRAEVMVGFSESPEHLNNTAPNIMNETDYGIRLA